MLVADLLATLESAHPADSVRILTRRDGVGDKIAAVKIEDAMVVAGDAHTVLLKPAVELREHAQERLNSTASHLQEVQRAIRNATNYRRAADAALRQAYSLLIAGQAEAAKKFLHDQLPENRSLAPALEPGAKAANGSLRRPAVA